MELNNALAVVTSDNEFSLSCEIADLEKKVEQLATVKKLKEKKQQLKQIQEARKQQEEMLIAHMRDTCMDELQFNGMKVKLSKRSSVETIVEDIEAVPQEFKRVKVEADKVALKKLYTETGVLVPGVEFKHKENYSLKISEVK